MARIKRVRWACPNGCPAVLGPSRPRKDDVCRFCLPCSSQKGRLVPRTAPALDKAREDRTATREARRSARAERVEARVRERYTVDGIDLRDEMQVMLRLPLFKDGGNDLRRNVPNLSVRRCTRVPRSRYGVCRFRYGRYDILIAAWPGLTATSVRETLLHELVHAYVGLRVSHGPRFRTAFRLASEQAFGVRPRLEVRYHGEVTGLVEKKQAADAAPPTEAS